MIYIAGLLTILGHSGEKCGTSLASLLRSIMMKYVNGSTRDSNYPPFIRANLSVQVVPESAPLFPRPDFFAGSRLNFAENLLYPAKLNIDENSPALIEATEIGSSTIPWAELRSRVQECALALHSHGVVESDRVAGFLGNHANAVVAMLAAASIGAIWTGVSPDTGVTAVLERLVQIQPKVLFVDNAVVYNGKTHSSHQKVKEILAGLKGLRAGVVFETVKGFEMKTAGLEVGEGKIWTYEEFVKR